MSAPASPANNAPRLAAWVGFALFLVGMGMVAAVFAQANALLAAPGPTVPAVTGTDPNGATNAALTLGADVTGFAQKLLVLLVECLVGAVFASLGVHVLFAAWNARPAADATPPSPVSPPAPP